MILLQGVLLLVCLVLSGVFSGSETGFYTLSRLRIEARARQGVRAAILIRSLLSNEGALLVTLLVGNNLALELSTHLVESSLDELFQVPAASRELAVTLVLTPVVFLFGELLPKDLFRRRPHRLVGLVAPLVLVAHYIFTPLTVPLRLLSAALDRMLGSARHRAAEVAGREAVVELLQQGTRQGTLEPHAERLARNALELRNLPIERAMVPFGEVHSILAERPEAELLEEVLGARHTRLPVVDEDGAIRRYVHQLDVLASDGECSLLEGARPLPALAPDTPVGRALSILRVRGQRMALVGTPEAPVGIVTLKDLVEEISGPLAGF